MKWPFSRKKSPAWRDLSAEMKDRVAGKIARAALGLARRAHFGRAYEAVSSPFSSGRRQSWIERGGEDDQLPSSDRHRLVNLARNMMRNSPTRVAQDQQIRVNVVGTVGGKLYASFPEGYAAAADEVTRYFNRVWAPRAEFSFGKSFNWILKTVLTAADNGGNVILVFDDGILTGGAGTGRIRGFEGDEIANAKPATFARLFGGGYSQSQGFVYDGSGAFAGAFVSTVSRGETEFEDGKFLTLRRDPFEDTPGNWIALGDMRRFNQGRAVSPLTAAITCLVDLHEICASERQGAKLNAQLVGQVLTTATDDAPGALGAFDDEAGEASGDVVVKDFSTKELNAIGAHFDQMPENMKIELLDTKRPNPNMPAYIEFLTGQVGGTRGLARVYATLKAQTSYTAFRGEQVMSWPSFEEAQKDLERDVCDWAARLVIARAVSRGEITADLPEGWEYMLAWQWPKMREVNQTDAENAFAAGLRSGAVTFFERFGPDWENRCVKQRAIEAKKFAEAGLVYPGDKDQNGQSMAKTTTEGGDDAHDEEQVQPDARALPGDVRG